MRPHRSAAAPLEARRKCSFRWGSAPPRRAHREDPPVSTDPLPTVPGLAPTWIPTTLAGTALVQPSGLCRLLPSRVAVLFSGRFTTLPCAQASKSSQARGTSSGVQMRGSVHVLSTRVCGWQSLSGPEFPRASGLAGVFQPAAVQVVYRMQTSAFVADQSRRDVTRLNAPMHNFCDVC